MSGVDHDIPVSDIPGIERPKARRYPYVEWESIAPGTAREITHLLRPGERARALSVGTRVGLAQRRKRGHQDGLSVIARQGRVWVCRLAPEET